MPRITRMNELERSGKIVKGRWELDSNHRLIYISENTFGKDEEEFQLETNLIAAEENALVMSMTGKQENGRTVTSLARLTGKWQANEKNQLEFEVKKKFGRTDTLTFQGAWKVGESNEIIYSYQTKKLKVRDTKLQTLVFKGFWDISEQNRITYLVEGSSDSAFRFRGSFQTPSILAKKGELRYQLGAEVSGKKQKVRTITLFGKWKLSDKLELVFEIDYGNGRKREIRFDAEFSPRKDFSIAARLINKEDDPLGIEVVLTKDFLESNAQAFVRLKKILGGEAALEAGIILPW